MNKTISLSFALLILLLSSCASAKQTSRQQAGAINWGELSTFNFSKVSFDTIPSTIGESVVQEIQEGIKSRFDHHGIAPGVNPDLLVNLHFSFDNPSFINNDNMNEVMKSLKYTSSWNSKLMGYYKDGIVTMSIINAKTGETIWTASTKGFVNKDGSEVARGANLQQAVSGQLFKGFPKTGKSSISAIKRKEAKELEKARKKVF